MKRIIAASAALALLAGAASAASIQTPERADPAQPFVNSAYTTLVSAGSIHSAKELSRLNLGKSDLVTVTDFTSAGIDAFPDHGDN